MALVLLHELVKGLEILSLKQLDILTTLQEAIQDKNFRHRESEILFIIDQMCK